MNGIEEREEAEIAKFTPVELKEYEDITGGEAAVRCAKWTGADGLMIGRSTFGDPWIFAEIKAAMRGGGIPRPPGAGRPDRRGCPAV